MFPYKWFFFTLAALLPSYSSIAAKQIVSKTITVDPSGRGGFRTIQSAINSVPPNNGRWIRIDIKAGVYKEQVKIPREKPFIYLKGAGKRNTLLEWNFVDDQPTFTAEADHTLAEGITFINSYNSHNKKPMAKAMAAKVQGNETVFYRCGFISLQDTLWDAEGRHYFKGCTIHGAVDFIYGNGKSIYQSCTMDVPSLNGGAGYITAQGRDDPKDSSGFVFKDCRIVGQGKAYLGRPWRPYARVLFYNTDMSDVVVPAGWNVWNSAGKENLLTLSEKNSRGVGARSSERVKWAKNLSTEEVQKLTSMSFIDNDGWVKEAFEVMSG